MAFFYMYTWSNFVWVIKKFNLSWRQGRKAIRIKGSMEKEFNFFRQANF